MIMIELRWLNKKIREFDNNTGAFEYTKRVLQYRYKGNFISGDICKGNAWSEWQDVPEVMEKS